MNPSLKWDLVPVYGVYMVAPGDDPVQGRVEFRLSQRVTRTDGRTIYPDGAKVSATIGAADEQDPDVRAAVRTAWRASDEAALGAGFDGPAWDVWWDTKVLPAAIFTGFPASDDPDVAQRDWTVTVKEALTGANGREYAIQPLLAHLAQPIPGINLGVVEVPPGSPTVPAPVYAKGIAGGVAALDADGDVVDAAGAKILGGGGGGGGAVGSVNGKTGTVILAAADVGARPAGNVPWVDVSGKPATFTPTIGATGTTAVAGNDARLAKADTAVQPAGLTKAAVGLGNVDNTTDEGKPVSTAQLAALNLKAPLASPAFTGTPTGITKTHVGLGNVDNTSDINKPVSTAQASAINAKVGSGNSTITGIELYATVGALPSPGVVGVLYIVDA